MVNMVYLNCTNENYAQMENPVQVKFRWHD